MLAAFICGEVSAQRTAVLPGNNNVSSLVSPQGAVRYQRQFYLINANETQLSGLATGMTINSIGFNIAVSQNIATKGLYRVYLQNTSDNISRMDTSWTTLNQPGTTLYLNSLNPGDYEWQVRASCNNSSVFSPLAYYELNGDTCKIPTNPLTTNVTSSAARLQWTLPAFNTGTYKVEYSERDVENWIITTTSANFLDVAGLMPATSYQWRVSTVCAGDSTKSALTYFDTNPISNCNNPSGLMVSILNDTTASISWAAATGAQRYDVLYRRTNTEQWTSTISFGATTNLPNLKAGTNYEWKVRTVCDSATYGDFVNGNVFLTTGAQACYPPEKLVADSLTNNSVKLSWSASAGATSYQVRYRLKETISWTNAIAGMTIVHNDSINIPDTTGRYDVQFANGDPFNFTGGGVYVAFEYIDSTGALSTKNTSLANYQDKALKDTAGRDSLRIVLSLGAVSANNLPPILSAGNSRPETWFGSNALQDSVAVLAVYAMGQQAIPYGNPGKISALVRNYTNSNKTYAVTLQVKDTSNNIKNTQVVNAMVKADSLLNVNFNDWSPAGYSKDSIIVSIGVQANENVINNNRNYYLQNVNSSLLGYEDGSGVVSAAGMDTATGIIMAKHIMNACGAVSSAQVYLDASAAGHPVYAVILDTSGTILAVSPAFTPESTDNGYHSFYFASAVNIPNGTPFYIGLAQPDSSTGYSPVGVQYEFGYTRDSAYYRAALDGSNISNHPLPGRLMIRAEIVPEDNAPYILGESVLCAGSTNVLSAAGVRQRFANSIVAFSSQNTAAQFGAAKALGTPDVYPAYGINPDAWMSKTDDGQREYLVLGFANPDSINFVDIYETFNPGSVDTVYVKDEATGIFHMVYSNTVTEGIDSIARIQHLTFPVTDFKVNEVRIAMNSPVKIGFSSIDAVSIGRIDSVPSFASYEWTRSVGNSQVFAGNTATLNATNPGTYILKVQTSGGCSASVTKVLTTPSQVVPVITAGGPLSFCIGDSVKLRSDRKGGNTWSTGATTDSIYVSTSGTYWVEFNDGSGCGPLRSSDVQVTVNSLPVVSITGQLGICLNGTTTLTASSTGTGNSYAWSNGAITAAAVISNPSSVSVKVTDINGCSKTTSTSTFRAPNPLPKIKGVLGFCFGGNTTLNVAAGFSSYLWKDGATGLSVSVNTVGKHYIAVTNSYGCKGTDTVNVIQFPGPTPRITGNLSICAGEPTTLNAGGGYRSYLWSTNETTQTITVSEPGIYTVTVTDENVCAGTISTQTKKDSLPPRPGPIGGSNSGVCNSPGTVFSIASVPEATHYVWFMPQGATIVSGQGSTSVVLSFDNTFSSGFIAVAASNTCGQSGDLVPRVLPLNVLPAKPSSISGNAFGICNSTQTFTTPVINSATTYEWTIPAGATLVSGQGTNTLNLSFSSSFTTGTLCVKAVNGCGKSDATCITVSGIAAMPASITGPARVCYKDGNYVYSTTAVFGANSYTWTVPNNATIISGQGSTSIVVKLASQNGNVTVAANTACGRSAAKSMFVITENCANGIVQSQRPVFVPTAEIILSPEVLANAGDVNVLDKMQLEWTLGEPIIEALASEKQWYTQGFHQPLIVLPVKTEHTRFVKIAIAPNPVYSILNVNIQSEEDEVLILHLMDVNGKNLYKKTINAGIKTIQIDLGRYSNGVYLLRVENRKGDVKQIFKVVKVS